MTAAEKIGCPSWFQLWDHGPWVATAIVLIGYFGIVTVLMFLEELSMSEFGRSRYLTFLVGGIVCWPVIAAAAAKSIESTGPLSSPFSEPWFHGVVFGLAVLVAFAWEIPPLKDGTFTWGQELSPSKAYHTLIFGPLLYMVVISMIVVISSWGSNHVPAIIAGIALVAFFAIGSRDRPVYWTDNRADPHVEWQNGELVPRYEEANKHGFLGGGTGGP